MGSSSQLYSLSWGEFSSSLVSAVQLLRGHGDLVDVTLAAGGRSFPAHKIVLCAASPFLLDLLKVVSLFRWELIRMCNLKMLRNLTTIKYDTLFTEHAVPASSGHASRDWSRWFGVFVRIRISGRGKRRAIAVAFLASGRPLFVHPWVNTANYSNGGIFLYSTFQFIGLK